MSDQEPEFPPMYGPPIDPVWLAQKRKRLIEEDEEAERYRTKTEKDHWFYELQERLRTEAEAWGALPCKGDVEFVSECTDEFAKTCPRNQHVMCARRQYQQYQEEAAQWRRHMASDARRKGVPDQMIKLLWEKQPKETEASKLLTTALKVTPPPTIVVLSGGVGCGKSCAAALWAIEKGAKFITANELARVSPYDEKATDLAKIKALVIDDLGCEYLDPKGFFLSHLDGLINDRYSNGRETVITTNLDAEGFRRYGERILDRIREAGKFLKVGGQSMRRKS